MKLLRSILSAAVVIGIANINTAAFACAACYGQSDSPMAKGMNAGIYAMLGVIGTVLSGASVFFVFLARRSASVAKSHDHPVS